MKKIVLILLAIVLPLQMAMAWEEDPYVNDAVIPDTYNVFGYDIQSNLNGMTYVFYQTSSSGGITMRLQVLDRDGQKTLGGDGVVVSDEANLSYTSVNQLMFVDREGNAVLPVSDCRAGNRQQLYTIYKVNEKGETLWSTTLNNAEVNGSLANMQVAQVEDGGYVFAYFRYGRDAENNNIYYVTLEKLSEDGESEWISNVYEEGTMISYPYLVNAGEGRVMLIYCVGNNYDLTAQLINADGSLGWDEPLTFYTGGFSPIRAIHTAINVKPAPDGGALVAWMHVAGTYETQLTWIRNDRTFAFETEDGSVLVSNNSTMSRYLPNMLYNEDDGNIYLTYRQFDQSHQENQGIYMQKISPKGELLWGEEGKPVVEVQSESQYKYPSIQRADNGNLAVFYQSLDGQADSGPVGSYITIFDADGNQVRPLQNFSTNDDTKSALGTTPLLDNDHYLAWWTVRPTSSTLQIMMQYVCPDGSTSGVQPLISCDNDQKLLREECFDVAGKRISAPSKGVSILRKVYANGDEKVEKHLAK
ncbi:MAG: hypothetical protein K6C10_02110 [Prevotella sp.]|nr:hypothetical protein [Prevotella sp.]